MDIRIKSNVFEVKIRFNRKLVLSAVCVFAALFLLLICSQSATATITIIGLLFCCCVAVAILLFSGFSVSCEPATPTKQNKRNKITPEQSGEPHKENRRTSHRPAPPVPKLDIPVPDYTGEKHASVPPKPSNSQDMEVPQDVTVVPDWKQLLSGKE